MANYRRTARNEARRAGINPSLFERQIGAESNFDPHASSGAGATGIAQFMPNTARGLGINPNNPNEALRGAAKLMASYLRQYKGDWRRALTAYNAGPGAVGKPLPGETRSYIQKILGGGSGQQSTPSGGGGGGGGSRVTGVSITPDKLVTGSQQVFDKNAFRAQQGLFMLGQLQQRHGRGGVLRKLGVIPTAEPSAGDFMRTEQWSAIRKGSLRVTRSGGGGGDGGVVGGDAQSMLQRAMKVNQAHPSYQWGGGHGPTPAQLGSRVDCSGFVSQVLGVSPRTSGQFMSFGKPGRGRQVTIYANSGHVLMQIGSRWFATSASNPGGGAGEIARPSASYLSRFVARHPNGM
jgi:hypothetical protein